MHRCFQQPEEPLVGFTVGQKMVKPTSAGGAHRIFNVAFKAVETFSLLLLVDFLSLLFLRHARAFFMSLFHLPKTSCANY